jgi:hypothetical protein
MIAKERGYFVAFMDLTKLRTSEKNIKVDSKERGCGYEHECYRNALRNAWEKVIWVKRFRKKSDDVTVSSVSCP